MPTYLVEEARERGLLDRFNGAYQHYSIPVDGFTASDMSAFTDDAKDVRQVKRYMQGVLPFADQLGLSALEVTANRLLKPLIEDLTRECASRMPYDFDQDGMDISFYTFGDQAFYVATEEENGLPRGIKGFRAVETDGDDLYLYIAYVQPQYRKQGVYRQLMSAALVYAKELGCKTVSVATDVSENNPMRGILENMGFYKTQSSFISQFGAYRQRNLA